MLFPFIYGLHNIWRQISGYGLSVKVYRVSHIVCICARNSVVCYIFFMLVLIKPVQVRILLVESIHVCLALLEFVCAMTRIIAICTGFFCHFTFVFKVISCTLGTFGGGLTEVRQMFKGAAISTEEIGCKIGHVMFFLPNVYAAFEVT